MAALIEAQRQAFGAGTYMQAVAQRATDTGTMLGFLVFFGPSLLGRVPVRRVVHAQRRDPRYRRAPAAVPAPAQHGLRHRPAADAVVGVDASDHEFLGDQPGQRGCADVRGIVANLLMMLGYLSSIVLAMQLPASGGSPALAGAGRAHGTEQLPDAVGGLHPGLLRLRPRLLRAPAARLAAGLRAGAVRAAGHAQSLVAGALPVRTDGMAVALDDLREAPGHAPRARAGLTHACAKRPARRGVPVRHAGRRSDFRPAMLREGHALIHAHHRGYP